MVADRVKKTKIAADGGSDHIDGDSIANLSMGKLEELQDQLDKVNVEVCEKVLEIEQKYNDIKRPVYARRGEIIKSIPDFWLTVFLSHPVLSDLLMEEDRKILKYLHSLEVEDFKDVKSGYRITFNFVPNPYFEDSVLSKTFRFSDEGTKITGTTIKWKEGMSAACGVTPEKKGNKRPPTDESFFNWFSESDTEQMDIAEVIQDEVADIIKDDLWSNPLKYFNNEADEEDSEGDEDNDEEIDKEE